MSSIAKPHLEEAPIEELEIFELIAKVIPHRETDTLRRIAKLYGCSEQTARKWRVDPAAYDDEEGDPHGRRSPVDNYLQFMDALNAIDPARAETVQHRVDYELAKMQCIQGNNASMRKWEAMKKANQLAREIVAVTDMGENNDG
jgi:hypothetical protein